MLVHGFTMRGHRSLIISALGMLALMGTVVRTSAAPELAPIHLKPANGVQPISLVDRLIVGLQARLVTEVAFCELVALKVETGKLPLRMVNETFFWARQRAALFQSGVNNRPIVYFQPAMRLRAQRLNIALTLTNP